MQGSEQDAARVGRLRSSRGSRINGRQAMAGALRCLRGPVPTLIPPVERLAKTADSRSRVPHVPRALGFSESPDVVPGLLECLGAKDGLEAKVAAQSLVAITGLDLRNDVFAAPKSSERPDSLPLLEEDALDADLVPPPEDALPPPNASAIRKWWSSQGGGLRTFGRLVLGKPRTPETLFDALERGPLGLHHVTPPRWGLTPQDDIPNMRVSSRYARAEPQTGGKCAYD